MLRFVFLFFLMSSVAQGKPFFCRKADVDSASKRAMARTGNDKNMHCSVSCLLTLRCHSTQVRTLGYLKELKDVFGPGDADALDIVADELGISLVLVGRAKSDRECFSECDLYYPR